MKLRRLRDKDDNSLSLVSTHHKCSSTFLPFTASCLSALATCSLTTPFRKTELLFYTSPIHQTSQYFQNPLIQDDSNSKFFSVKGSNQFPLYPKYLPEPEQTHLVPKLQCEQLPPLQQYCQQPVHPQLPQQPIYRSNLSAQCSYNSVSLQPSNDVRALPSNSPRPTQAETLPQSKQHPSIDPIRAIPLPLRHVDQFEGFDVVETCEPNLTRKQIKKHTNVSRHTPHSVLLDLLWLQFGGLRRQKTVHAFNEFLYWLQRNHNRIYLTYQNQLLLEAERLQKQLEHRIRKCLDIK